MSQLFFTLSIIAEKVNTIMRKLRHFTDKPLYLRLVNAS